MFSRKPDSWETLCLLLTGWETVVGRVGVGGGGGGGGEGRCEREQDRKVSVGLRISMIPSTDLSIF